MKPHILYEDQDIIVCLKPAGIPTQTSRPGLPDMVSILKNHIYQNSVHKKQPYLAVIHRLDQPVEGLLVFAKTPAAAKELNRQLQSFGFGKYYLAVLLGCPQTADGILEDYLVKDGRTNTSRICTEERNFHWQRFIWIPDVITRFGYKWLTLVIPSQETENMVRTRLLFPNCSSLPAVWNSHIQKQKSTWNLPMRLFCVFLPTKHQQIILSDNRISIGNESASFSFDHDNEHPCFLVQLIYWFIPPLMIFVNFQYY